MDVASGFRSSDAVHCWLTRVVDEVEVQATLIGGIGAFTTAIPELVQLLRG